MLGVWGKGFSTQSWLRPGRNTAECSLSESSEETSCALTQVFSHSCLKHGPGLDSSPHLPPRDKLGEQFRAWSTPVKANLDVYYCSTWASLVAQIVKRLPTMRETWGSILGWEDPLEKEMATHFTILAWKPHGQRTLVGYSPWCHEEPDTIEWFHFLSLLFHLISQIYLVFL